MSEMLGSGPSAASREQLVADTILRLTDSLADDYDVVDVLDLLVTRCVSLVGVSAAAVLLDDQQGNLAVVAASSEPTRLLEIFELQNEQGPGVDCVRAGADVASPDFAARRSGWPAFIPAARAAGFRSGYALPLRLRNDVIGGLDMFHDRAQPLSADSEQRARTMAAAAAIGILQRRQAHRSAALAGQLQHALDSRVVIEQAKGILAERRHLDMDAAFETLRHHARSHNIKLNVIAAAVVGGQLDPAHYTRPEHPPPR
jgi:transcriptional regulator with GAF, ATPase, and Fis domain